MQLGKLFLLLGSLSATVAVALGAFGAHGLKKSLTPPLLEIYQTGVQYHFYHALGLLLIGVAAFYLPASVSTSLRWSGWLLFIGTLLFSGSLYLLAVSGIRWLGAITPLGGSAFIIGWLVFAWAVWTAN